MAPYLRQQGKKVTSQIILRLPTLTVHPIQAGLTGPQPSVTPADRSAFFLYRYLDLLALLAHPLAILHHCDQVFIHFIVSFVTEPVLVSLGVGTEKAGHLCMWGVRVHIKDRDLWKVWLQTPTGMGLSINHRDGKRNRTQALGESCGWPAGHTAAAKGREVPLEQSDVLTCLMAVTVITKNKGKPLVTGLVGVSTITCRGGEIHYSLRL